jgi:transcriptional regulator with XRE-family HTH domain
MAYYDPEPPIGAALRAIRTERGCTIEEAASRGKITANYLGDVERSERNPTMKVVARLLAGLKVTWTEFGAVLDRLSASDPPRSAR